MTAFHLDELLPGPIVHIRSLAWITGTFNGTTTLLTKLVSPVLFLHDKSKYLLSSTGSSSLLHMQSNTFNHNPNLFFLSKTMLKNHIFATYWPEIFSWFRSSLMGFHSYDWCDCLLGGNS